jgi:very-short-patch-repair endonuclease
VSHKQLIACGFTPAMIKSRLQSGALRIVWRGVYAVGHVVDTELGDEVAALLVCGGGAVLSHETAAALWQIVPEPFPDVHVTMLGARQSRSRDGLVVHRTSSLTRTDVRRHRGLALTAPARTVIDFAERRARREAERAVDEALARRLLTPASLRETSARMPGRGATRFLEDLLDPARAVGVTVGHAEERMLSMLRAAGLPDPRRNARLGPYTVDFLWPAASVALEVDSYTWHSSPGAFKRDRRKDAYLADRGIQLIRVTWEMMDEPVPLIARLVRTLTQRTGPGPGPGLAPGPGPGPDDPRRS